MPVLRQAARRRIQRRHRSCNAVLAEVLGRRIRGKRETLLKKGSPPSPRPPFSFLKRVHEKACSPSTGHGGRPCALRQTRQPLCHAPAPSPLSCKRRCGVPGTRRTFPYVGGPGGHCSPGGARGSAPDVFSALSPGAVPFALRQVGAGAVRAWDCPAHRGCQAAASVQVGRQGCAGLVSALDSPHDLG